MPLLNKRPFVRNPVPTHLSDNDKVFFCEMTGEVFTQYEEFWERLVLCNSMVWCCELTGRPNLTFTEAVESEGRARRCLANIPQLVRRPMLYLASLTRRGRFVDLAEDVFLYVRDRYFVGEEVEAIVHNHWYDCKVTRVIAPTPDEIEKYLRYLEESDEEMEDEKDEEPEILVIKDDTNTKEDDDDDIMVIKEVKKGEEVVVAEVKKKEVVKEEKKKKELKELKKDEENYPPYAIFKYEVVELEAWDYKNCKTHIVGWEQIRRNKGTVTREKCKLFLKQSVQLSPSGFWVIKEKITSLYGLADAKFEDIFPGPAPKFRETRAKKMPLSLNPDRVTERKRERKEAREKTEAAGTDGKKRGRPGRTEEEKEAKKKLLKESKEAREEILAEQREKLKQKLEKEKEERQKEREIKREEKKIRLQYIKEWNRVRDDLDCDDHKDLPQPAPVICGIPDQEFSNFLTVLEFVNIFWEVVELKDVYPQGITFEMLETGLIEKEVAGVYSDLLQLLLQALFTLQEEEDDEVKEDASEDLGLDGETRRDQAVEAAAREANRTTTWIQHHHGNPLQKLQLDTLTLTEVLRLHLLASGATCGANARWRHFNRGGYKLQDDPGLHFKMQEPELLKKLKQTTVFDLSIGEKLKILNTLIGQILTYASLRDTIDDNIEELKNVKNTLRLHQQTAGRHEREIQAAKQQEKRDQKQKEKEKLLKAAEKKGAGEQKPGEEGAQNPESEKKKEEEEEEVDEEEEEDTEDEAEKMARQEREAKNNEARRQEMKRREAELVQKVLSASRGVNTEPLGQDRAYRRYWIFSSLPGLFVEDYEPNPGICRATPTPHHPDSLARMMEEQEAAIRAQACQNLAQTPDTPPTSDKENAGPAPPKPPATANPPSRPLHLANGAQATPIVEPKPEQKEAVGIETAAPVKLDEKESVVETPPAVFGLCTANMETCPVHVPPPAHHRWHFFPNQDQLSPLLEGLNPRGYRERHLHSSLTELLAALQSSIKACPVSRLNPSLSALQEMEGGESGIRKSQRHTGAKKDTNLNFPVGTPIEEVLKVTLTDIILETEEKLHIGMLGNLQQPLRREEWRNALVSGVLPVNPNMDYGGKKRMAQLRAELGQDADDCLKTEEEEEEAVSGGEVKEEEGGKAVSEEVNQLRQAILHLARAVETKYLHPPLGETDKARRSRERAQEAYLKKKKRKEGEEADSDEDDEEAEEIKSLSSLLTPLERWEASLMASTSLPQVCLYFATLDNSISWAHSAANTRCRVCRRKNDPESILLCDGCNKGTHLHCLKPQLKEVPAGDWYCDRCRPKERPKSPRKKRQIYHENSDEEEEEEEEEEDEEEEEEQYSSDVCYTCSLVGTLICCDTCPLAFHPECVALRKVPRGSWSCPQCTEGKDGTDDKKKSSKESSKSNKDGGKNKSTPKAATPKTATPKNNTPKNATAKKTPKSAANTPKGTTPKNTPKSSRGSPKGQKGSPSPPGENNKKRQRDRDTPTQSAKRAKTDNASDSPSRRLSGRRSLVDESSSLNTAALTDLLEELQKHPESCHFNKPVSKKLAPDYYDVVRKPMDLGRVREKLNTFKYTSDGEFMADVMLVFQNCQQYNLENTPEYRAGCLLADMFMSRVSKLGLALPHLSPSSVISPSGRKRRR